MPIVEKWPIANALLYTVWVSKVLKPVLYSSSNICFNPSHALLSYVITIVTYSYLLPIMAKNYAIYEE